MTDRARGAAGIGAWFRSRFAGRQGGLPRPNRPAYIVGDIHGRRDLLDRLLSRMKADQQANDYSDSDLVFVGDYIDRGEDSAGVLRRLRDLTNKNPERVTCLLGNHEQMCLRFLAGDPVQAMSWLRNGGIETLHSFSLDGAGVDDVSSDLDRLRNEACLAIGADLVNWLTKLPLWWQSGDVVAAHAGLLPDHAPKDQPDHVLVWGSRACSHPRTDGLWVVHGHTVTRPPAIDGRRIAIDTGAYFSETLTCAVLAQGQGVRFIDTAPRA